VDPGACARDFSLIPSDPLLLPQRRKSLLLLLLPPHIALGLPISKPSPSIHDPSIIC